MTQEELCRMEQSQLVKLIDEGKLVYLPCKVEDTVYVIAKCDTVCKQCDYDYFCGTGEIQCPFEKVCDFEECNDENERIFETECSGFWLEQDGGWKVFLDYINADIGVSDIGKTVFLTREEAEKALKEREVNGK